MDLRPLRIVKATESLLPAVTATASGVGTALSGYAGADALIFKLNVTAASGTTPTLDVVVQDTNGDGDYFTIATFTQAVAVGKQVQRISTAVTPTYDTLRVSYTIGGTTPSFTFSVTAYAEAKLASDRQP